MPRRLIDISVPLKAGIKSDPPHSLPKIEYMDHHMTAPAMAEYMGVRVDQLPDGEYAAVERATISTHNGTHLDAPYHYFSTMNHRLKPGGEPSWRIDEVPLEWCFQPAVKLDFRQLPRWLCRDARRCRSGTEAHRPHAEAAGDRRGQHLGWREIWRRRLRRFRLRHGQGGNAVDAGARRAAGRHRRVELGCTVLAHAAQGGRDRRCRA